MAERDRERQARSDVALALDQDRMIKALVWAIILAGWIVRAVVFLKRPALWVDEARVSLNIASRSWIGLLAPLDHDQTAPIPFLWAVRLSTGLGGVNELSLRAVAFLAGLALLPALWFVGRRLFGTPAAAVAVACAAFSPRLVQYANEVKQYQTDALATVAALALYAVAAGHLRRRGVGVALGAGGAMLLFVSQPVALVLGGIAVALLLGKPWDRAAKRNAILASGVWAATFVALYLISYRQVAGSEYMQTFWEETFLTPTAEDFRYRLFLAGKSLLAAPLPGPKFLLPLQVYALVFVLGILQAGRGRQIHRAVLLGAPFAALGLVATLGLYPVAARLVLFLAPLLFLTYASALVGAAQVVRVGRPALIGLVALIGLTGGWTSRRVFRSHGPWNARTMVEFLRHQEGTQPVYVYAGGLPAWVFYTTDWASPDRSRLDWYARITGHSGPAFENAPPRGRPVQCEGDELTETWEGRSVLFGVPAGIQAREPSGWTQATPDTGWAANEARRILHTGSARVWVLAVHFEDRWIDQLVAALEPTGAHLLSRRAARGDEYGAALYEFRLPDGGVLAQDLCATHDGPDDGRASLLTWSRHGR